MCASAAAFYVTTYSFCSTISPYVPFPLPAMCPSGKFQKSYNHSRLHGDGERANIRFSWLPTFPSASRLYLIFYASLPFTPFSIFLRCLSLRELFNRFPILYLHFLFPFLFSSASLRTKAKNVTKIKNCPALLLIPHDDLVLAIISDDLLRVTNGIF